MHGFYRVMTASPLVRVADVAANVAGVVALAQEAEREAAALVVFPELALTGYTCGDLFLQRHLLDAARTGLLEVAAATAASGAVLVVGVPLLVRQRLYNCAAVLHAGRVLGVVPKCFLPNYKEFYEKRWFTSGQGLADDTLELGGGSVPFGADLLFSDGSDFVLGVELCEDLWNIHPPSSTLALAGATVLANPSASDDLVGKAAYRRALVSQQSARCVAAYAYVSAGARESSTDVVYGGHALIAENGALLAERERFLRRPGLLAADVDCRRLVMTRLSETSHASNAQPRLRTITLPALRGVTQLRRAYEARPFVPGDAAEREERCHEIFQIQATGLANRLEHTGAQCSVIGISGGLDSTLALLVAGEAWNLLGQEASRVLAVTMPGYGTTSRTRANALKLCHELGATTREIDIRLACAQHFTDIGHDPAVHDVTYENVQARERTQLLMDLANKQRGLVIGTGDLSELALGWSTYNGDHMSMYAVNCGVPKTLVRYLVEWVAERSAPALQDTLRDVLATPISPELLPLDAQGQSAQKTEDVVGPYELHDFFLYHFIKYGAEPDKLRLLANHAFGSQYTPAVIDRWLRVFLTRFFAQQFKRSCIPDGPKVGTISLSPRGDWRMPSDAAVRLWLEGSAAP